MKPWFVILAITLVGWCNLELIHANTPGEKGFRQLLEKDGLTNVDFKSSEPYQNCALDDYYRKRFVAYRATQSADGSVKSVKVKGTVCTGVLKGSTVRYQK